jgi:hypothetical protein
MYFRECKLRVPQCAKNLSGCDVSLVVRPGTFRHRRGRTVVDLFAHEIQVVRRSWLGWCVY